MQLMRTPRNTKQPNARHCHGQGNGTTIRMPDALDERVRELARRHGLKVADIVRNSLYVQIPIWEAEGVRLARVPA